jgi:hypothetical protein
MQLPKYTIENKTYNAYNRKNIVQQAIKYDPVSITFHDDSADVLRDLWYDYMSYYYRDTDYSTDIYLANDKYNTRQKQAWGFTPSGSAANPNARLIQRIRLYSLHQKQFTEYVLINPVITSFQHGEHQQGQNETMQHTMTLQYETVLYNYGTINPGQDINFAELHYDNTPSPLGIPSLAGSLIDSLTGGAGLGGALGGIVSGLTGTLPKTGDQQLPGDRTKFAASAGVGGVNALLNQLALGISKGNNPLQNLSIPTLAGYAQTITAGNGGSGLLGTGLGTSLGAVGGGAVGGITGLLGSFRGAGTNSGNTPNTNLASAALSPINVVDNSAAPASPGTGAVSNGDQVVTESYSALPGVPPGADPSSFSG